MNRPRPRSDADLEYMIGIVRNDPTAARVGRRYSRDEIRAVEESVAPWLRMKNWAEIRWAERQARSS